MILLFFICLAIIFGVGVILGAVLPEETVNQIPDKIGIVCVGGVFLGIGLFVVGLFTNTGQYEQHSYEDWHGNTVTYMADKLSDRIWLGIFIGILSIVGPIVLILATSLGQSIREKAKSK